MDRRLIWIDCEMTREDVKTGKLMEIAAVVTTSERGGGSTLYHCQDGEHRDPLRRCHPEQHERVVQGAVHK